jgi:alanyl-tRNA synthetase
MTSQEIRQQFIDFFVQKHGHTFVPSSPVVPHDDPTLLFTNAGMNQFKPIFLGQEKRAYTRAVNTQKCIRAGGKHNDLDDVGRSRRHHTFFEMLGNWSFGDYFKRGAIEMAWELLTNVWKLDPTRLHVSCYEGNEAAGIPRDTEAANIWKEVAGVPEDHIHYFGKDNFWEMGDTGPCGPCTEIYYDRTKDKSGGKDVNGENPEVMEIWNNVFIQYNRDASGKLTTLPSQHVDTGMGLERICQVLQDKQDNFGTDLWTPLFDRISELSGLKYTGLFPKTNAADPVAEAANAQLRHDIAFRVVADHARCLTFALTDGAVPSNEGRGYVLRRILRRAVRFGRQHLGLREPFVHRLVPVIVESMGNVFPELKRNPQHVIDLVKDEEVSFGRTLDRGIQLFEDAARADARRRVFQRAVDRGQIATGGASTGTNASLEIVKAESGEFEFRGGQISASDAFKLHDTYGFPIDLTRIMAEERGMTVDITGYEELMERAKELARSGGKEGQSKIGDLTPYALSQLSQAGVKPTDDQPKFSHDPIEARVMAIWNGDDLGLSPADVLEDEELAIILDRTNFYAEMGGQVGDAGELRTADAIFDVAATHVVGGYVMHIGKIRSGKLRVRDTVTATVSDSRMTTEKNHTTTHIANWALRETLGDAVQQKGSLVDPEKLRFDFSHGKSLSDEELTKVEMLVTEGIAKKLPVYAEVAPQEQALKIHGLRAVFGEKYPPMVRVVSVGVPVAELLRNPSNPEWRKYSIEFCGGTHLANSAQAQAFAITAEESVSKGIRRIVALTGNAAKYATEQAAVIDDLILQSKTIADADVQGLIAALQKAVAAGNVPLRAKRRGQAAIGELQARYKAWEKANKSQSTGSGVDAIAVASELLDKAPTLGGGKIVVGEIPGASDEQLRSAIDSLKKKSPSHGVLLGAAIDGKVSFVAVVSDDLIKRGLKAGDWVREAAKVTGGGGGGRPQMAQAGGKDPAKLPEALARAASFATEVIK